MESQTNQQKLLEFVSNNGLMIAAPDDFTYFPTERRFVPDILDIVLIQNSSIPLTDHLDHVPVVITIEVRPHGQQPVPCLINGEVDWDI